MAIDGDRLYFRGGEYTADIGENILIIEKGISLYGGWDGAPTGPIVLDPEFITTTFNGQNERRAILVDYTNSDPEPISISGFNFINGSAENAQTGFGGAIYIKNGGVLVEDNHFHYNQAIYYGGAISIDSTLPVGIENNLFTDNRIKPENIGGGGAISVLAGTPDVSIEGNQFSGGSADYGTAIHSNASILISRNLLMDVGGNSAIILITSGVPPSKIVNNVIVNSDTALRFSNAATAAHQVWNNTIVDCDLFGIDVGVSNVNLVNNIISGCGTSITIGTGGVLTGSHNLFYNNFSSDETLPVTDSLIDVPPSFVDAANDDYHLANDSEAIDAGTTVDLLFDFDGEARFSGSGFDIGADEVMTTLYLFLPLIQR